MFKSPCIVIVVFGYFSLILCIVFCKLSMKSVISFLCGLLYIFMIVCIGLFLCLFLCICMIVVAAFFIVASSMYVTFIPFFV